MAKSEKILVLITGSRNEDAELWSAVNNVLERYKDYVHTKVVVIHGNCETGADAFAEEISNSLGIQTLPMDAEWGLYFKGAGPKRNKELVTVAKCLMNCGWQVHGYAFPRGKSNGTRDCMDQMVQQGITFEIL